MMEDLYNPKIKPKHPARKAIVYVDRSTDKRVRQNKESQILQYADAERVPTPEGRYRTHSVFTNGSRRRL